MTKGVRFHGVNSGPLKALRPILLEWLALMEDSSWWEWEKIPDAPWWYNERALLSQFAGAIWRCKGRALEEFVATKRELKLRRKARRKDAQGARGDLEFRWPQDKFFYVSEAKLRWPSIRANPPA